MKPPVKTLAAWIKAAAKQLPDFAARQEGGGLVLEWCGRQILLPEDRIGQFSRKELDQLEGPFLDLRTGLLSVTEPGVLIRVRVSAKRTVLTAKLSALVALGLLPRIPPQGAAAATPLPTRLLLVGKQRLLAREWSREFGVDISPMTVNRLLAALRDAGLLDDEPRDFGELPLKRTLELLRDEFRPSGIGRRVFFRCGPGDLDVLAERLGAGFARGTSFVLSRLTGGWLERHAGDLLELYCWARTSGGTFSAYASVRRNTPEVQRESAFLRDRVQAAPVDPVHASLFEQLREVAAEF